MTVIGATLLPKLVPQAPSGPEANSNDTGSAQGSSAGASSEPMSASRAIQVLNDSFSRFATASQQDKTGNKRISHDDLIAMRDGKVKGATKDERDAATYFLMHEKLWSYLDTAGNNSSPDGVVGQGDVKAYLESDKAIRVLNDNFSKFDTASQANQMIGRNDLIAIRNSKDKSVTQEQKDAAVYFLNHTKAFDTLARLGGDVYTVPTNAITQKDLDSYNKNGFWIAPADFRMSSYLSLLSPGRQAVINYAAQYAKESTDDPKNRNPKLPSFENNCANFVSQTLLAGGLQPKDGKWFCAPLDPPNKLLWPSAITAYKAFAWKRQQEGKDYHFTADTNNGKWAFLSSTWNDAKSQYEYFSNPANGYVDSAKDTITISKEDIKATTLKNNGKITGSQKLDALWQSKRIQPGDLLYWSDGKGVHHASIITDVSDEDIFFSENSNSKYNESLTNKLNDPTNTDTSITIVHLKDSVFKQ